MGTGKSTVGRRLARHLGLRFIDTDEEIERLTGKTIQRIFREDGERRFRSEEALLCRRVASAEGLVIATGGGMVLDPENVRLLRRNGILIGLKAHPDVIFQRVRRKENRPLLQGDTAARIKELLNARQGVYDVADVTIDTGDKSPEDVVDVILEYLEGRYAFG